jgi:hypothetical protein
LQSRNALYRFRLAPRFAANRAQAYHAAIATKEGTMHFHWLAILVAAVAGFAVGGVWYGPLFGKPWMAARGFTPESAKQNVNMPMIFGLTFVLNLVAAFMLDHLYATYDAPIGFHHSLLIAGIIGVGFIATSIGVNYLFSRMPRALFLIDAGYWIVIYLVMGAIFGWLR